MRHTRHYQEHGGRYQTRAGEILVARIGCHSFQLSLFGRRFDEDERAPFLTHQMRLYIVTPAWLTPESN